MNTEKLKQDIARAIEMAESIRKGMLDEFIAKDVPSEVLISALKFTGQLTALKCDLEHISEEVSA